MNQIFMQNKQLFHLMQQLFHTKAMVAVYIIAFLAVRTTPQNFAMA